jgi:hypothetical protein
MIPTRDLLPGVYDVQLDTVAYEEGEAPVVEIDVSPMYRTPTGRTTDLGHHLARVVIPANGFEHEGFIMSDDTEWLGELPPHVREGYDAALALIGTPARRYSTGDTVWITAHRMPGEIADYSTKGAYFVELAHAGVYDFFDEDQLEPFDPVRYETAP